jgi:regulatory protein
LADALRARALRLLGRREHSRAELTAKLKPDTDDPKALEQLLDEFEQRGWLSETRVADSVLHARRGRFGVARIEHELRAKGLSPEVIERAVDQAAAMELESARAVWSRKFGQLPVNLTERGRQSRFLASRGFSPDVIRQVLNQRDE